MTAEQFAQLQTALYTAFGPLVMWWLILFAVIGIGVIAVLFLLGLAMDWIDL
jgi:hypothetical protein